MQLLCKIGWTQVYVSNDTQGATVRATKAMLDALPPMTPAEVREALSSHRAMRIMAPWGMHKRSLRVLHHTVSFAAVYGNPLAPGELALAHLGALVLTNTPLFWPSILASLPATLHRGHVRGVDARPVYLVLHVEP